MKSHKNIAGLVTELLAPLAAEQGVVLWDVEFVKEGARQVLRITLDSERGITIDDCERFHRAADPLLDAADPVDSAYYLEVSSPGVERDLKSEAHFDASAGCEVQIKLYAPDDSGRKVVNGTLVGLADGVIRVRTPEGEREVLRCAAAKVRTVYNF